MNIQVNILSYICALSSIPQFQKQEAGPSSDPLLSVIPILLSTFWPCENETHINSISRVFYIYVQMIKVICILIYFIFLLLEMFDKHGFYV